MNDLIGTRTLNDLLAERVERAPDKTWMVFEDRTGTVSELTYSQFADRVQTTAQGLHSHGVRRGDPVVVHLRNCPEFVITWFALARLGAVMVPSNVANSAPEMEHIVTHADVVAAVTQPDYLDVLQKVAADSSSLRTIVVARSAQDEMGTTENLVTFDGLKQGQGPLPDIDLDNEDVMQMLFTSGTTARPKGVLLTHANALHAGERTARGLGLDSSDRCLTSLPVFHVNAQCLTVLGALTAGATCILLEEFSASRYWDQLREHHATQTSVVAMQVRTMLARPPSDTDGQHKVRRFVYAINVTDSEKEAFENRFAVRFINAYGLSEAMTLVAMSPVFGPQRWPSVGLPATDRVVRIVGDDGEDVMPGDVGEIVVGGVPGRTIMKGYFNDQEATTAVLCDGWLRTGDHGYLDEVGYLYFFDRRKDVIKRAGENVSASEVESVLIDHPGIVEAAVIGVTDPVRDEAVKAFIVLNETGAPTIEEIKDWCSGRLARFKVPTLFDVRDELPKTSIGKIQKKVLRD